MISSTNCKVLPTKIVFMNSISPNVWRGGEKWMVNAAAGLAERGHDVLCVGKNSALWLEHARMRGVRTLEFPIHGDVDPIILTRLYLMFRKEKTEVLCCNFEKDVRLGGVAAKLAGVNKVYVRKGLTLLYDKLRYRLPYRYLVDGIITPAHFIKKSFSRFSWVKRERIHVIPNGIAIPEISGFQKKKLWDLIGVEKNGELLFGAGSLFAQKGFEYLIEALAAINKNGRNVLLAIAGKGDQEPYKSLAVKFGVSDKVFFLGERNDICELMYCADVFVLSSIDEGLPNVVLEALSVGCPVVASDAGGTSEIIENGKSGTVVPIKDAKALASAIEYMLQNPEIRNEMGSKGLRRVRECFSMEAMVTNVECLLCNKAVEDLVGRV